MLLVIELNVVNKLVHFPIEFERFFKQTRDRKINLRYNQSSLVRNFFSVDSEAIPIRKHKLSVRTFDLEIAFAMTAYLVTAIKSISLSNIFIACYSLPNRLFKRSRVRADA